MDHAQPTSDLPGLTRIHRGKVRDVYALPDQRLLMVFAATYTYLLAQPLAGWLLYLRRGPLLLHTEFSPEQDRAAAAAAQAQALEDQLDLVAVFGC